MPAPVRPPARLGAYLPGLILAIAMLHQPANGAEHAATPAPRVAMRKCVASDGSIAFQSQPCRARTLEAWLRDAPPDVPRVAAAMEAKPRAAAQYGVRSARRLSARRWDGRDSSRRQRCDAARIEAARKRDREWNRLGFDALVRLDDWVAERCR